MAVYSTVLMEVTVTLVVIRSEISTAAEWINSFGSVCERVSSECM